MSSGLAEEGDGNGGEGGAVPEEEMEGEGDAGTDRGWRCPPWPCAPFPIICNGFPPSRPWPPLHLAATLALHLLAPLLLLLPPPPPPQRLRRLPNSFFTIMGCTSSRVFHDEEAPAALRPVQQKIDEIKRRNRMRMGSASAIELLRPVEPEEEDSPLAEEPLPKVVTATTDMKATLKPGQVDEEKGRKLGTPPSDEELPGSPSFRYYCVAVVPVDDNNCVGSNGESFKEPGHVNKNELKEEDNQGHYQSKDSNESQISERSEAKRPEKKEKGRRIRGWLNVQICYCSHSAMEVNGHNESPRLIIGKVV